MQALVHYAVVVAAAAAVFYGLRRYRPGPVAAGAWRWVGAATALTALAGVQGDRLAGLLGTGDGVALADIVRLAALLPAAAVLWRLGRHRHPERDRGGALDLGIILVDAGLLLWTFVLQPMAWAEAGFSSARLVAVAYSLVDLLLLAVVVRLSYDAGARPVSLTLLLTGAALLIGADTVAKLLAVAGVDPAATPVGLGWTAWAACWGVAALHPSMRRIGEPGPPRRPRLTRWRLAHLVACALTLPALLAARALHDHTVEEPVLYAGVLALLTLGVLRTSDIAGQIETYAAEREWLLDRLVGAAEEERTRLAAALHDGPIQRLTSISYLIMQADHRLGSQPPEAARRLLARVSTSLGTEIDELRGLMSDLRPPALDEWGLPDALRQHAKRIASDAGLGCDLRIDPETRLEPRHETELYRVAQEALANATKHAHATQVWVTLDREAGGAHLSVRDNGVGFEPAHPRPGREPGHYGLAIMRERVQQAGGSFQLLTEPGRGTTVHANIPTPAMAPRRAYNAEALPEPRTGLPDRLH